MAKPLHNAIHGYSDDEVFDAIQEHLEEVGFNFTKSPFNPDFDRGIVADIETASGDFGKGRGFYYIYENRNHDTGESWASVMYNTFSGNQVQDTWSFADYYKKHKAHRQALGVVHKHEPTPEELAALEKKRLQRQANKEAAEHNRKLDKIAAKIFTSFELSRATETRTHGRYTFHISQDDYIKNKGFPHAFGMKYLPSSSINIDDLKKFIDLNYQHENISADDKDKLADKIQFLQDDFIENKYPKNDNQTKEAISRRKFSVLMLPLINTSNEVVSMQLLNGFHNRNLNQIDEFGRKKVTSQKALLKGGNSKGAFQPINLTGADKDFQFDKDKRVYTIGEGWATAVSMGQLATEAYPQFQHNMQHLFGVNKVNLADVALEILKVNPKAIIFIGYDNDASKLKNGANAGLEQACIDFSDIGRLKDHQNNVRAIFPNFSKNDAGCTDWNDMVCGKGKAFAVSQFKETMDASAERRRNNVNEYDYAVAIYDQQRADWFNNLSKSEQNEYRNPTDTKKSPYVIKFSTVINEKVEDKKFKEEFEANKNKSKESIQGVLPKDLPMDSSLNFKYDFNKPAPVPGSNNILDLLKSVDLDAARNAGMKVTSGSSLNGEFIQATSTREMDNAIPVVRAKSNSSEVSLKSQQNSEVSIDKNSSHVEPIDKRKSELFTAYWLYQSELNRSNNLLRQAASLQDNLPIQDKVKELGKMEFDLPSDPHVISQGFALIASDPELRASLLEQLNMIVEQHPEWENLGKLTNHLTDNVIAMEDQQRANLLLQNKVITKLIASIDNSVSYDQSTLDSIKESLNSTSQLQASRIARQSMYLEMIGTLESCAQEPAWIKDAIKACETYMEKSLVRLNEEKVQNNDVQPPDLSQQKVNDNNNQPGHRMI